MIACILGHLLSSDDWPILMFLFWLCLLYVEQLIHMYDFGSNGHFFNMSVPAHRGQITFPLISRNVWLDLEHLKQLLAAI